MIPCSMKKGRKSCQFKYDVVIAKTQHTFTYVKNVENVQFRINKMIGIFGFPLCKENI